MDATAGQIELLFSTGDPAIDRVLRGWIAVYEAAFPGRLRCFTLAGGYAEGTATPFSDVDGGPVFRGEAPLSAEEFWRAHRLLGACSDLCGIHLDANVGVDNRLYAYCDTGDVWASRGAVEARVCVKLAHRIIWGEEFRDSIPLPPIEWWARACFFSPPHHYGAPYFMAVTRGLAHGEGRDARPLVYPLDYPDPADTFYGYARYPLTARDGTVHLTTRGLVRTALHGAMALLAWKARRYVTHKAELAAAYREHVGGPWAGFVGDVDLTCRVELGYLVPADRSRRERLRAFCRDMPAFENYLLDQHKAFVLEEIGRAAHDTIAEPWLPAELAGWLLEASPDDVQALAAAGRLPSTILDGRRCVAAGPCVARWAAAMLGRVLYPGDAAVAGALDALAAADIDVVRQAAQTALAALGSPRRTHAPG